MSLLPFFTWCDGTWLGVATRSVTWAFPAIETTHILALAVLLGSILLVDLRLLGLAVPRIPAPKLQRELNRNINWSLVIILASGVPQWARPWRSFPWCSGSAQARRAGQLGSFRFSRRRTKPGLSENLGTNRAGYVFLRVKATSRPACRTSTRRSAR